MKFQKILFQILVIMCPVTIFSQNTFFRYFSTMDNACAYKACETLSGAFILAGQNGYSMANTKGFLMKISPEGELIAKVNLPDSINSTSLVTLNHLPDLSGQYLTTGFQDSIGGPDLYNNLILNLIDDDLNFLSVKKIKIEKNHFLHPWQLKFSESKSYYLLGNYIDSESPNIKQIGIIKFALPFDSIASYFSTGTSFHSGHDLLFLNEQHKLSIFYMGGLIKNKSTGIQILELDSNLQFLSAIPFPDFVITQSSSVFLTDSSYIFTAVSQTPEIAKFIATYIMSNSHDTIKRLEIYNDPDTMVYSGTAPNTAINGQNIFISGIYNIDPSVFPFQQTNTWLQVTRLDLSLNIISNHFYGDDAAYMPFSITATSDGGAFLTGYRYDKAMNKFDVFVMKVDSEGIITENQREVKFRMSEAILAPNPGHDKVSAIVGAQYKSADIFLYDLNGKTILYKKLEGNRQTIDLSGLKPGSYVYVFTSENKKIGQGKWIRQ